MSSDVELVCVGPIESILRLGKELAINFKNNGGVLTRKNIIFKMHVKLKETCRIHQITTTQ